MRPNQALQRTGSVCGLTVLPRFQLRRRSGWPLNTSSLGRTHSGLVLLRTRAVSPTRGPSRVSASGPHGPRRLHPLRSAASGSVRVLAGPALRSPSRLKLRSALGQGAASSTSPACGLTRQCSGPGVCAGLQCSPQIRAAVVAARPLIASSLGRTRLALDLRRSDAERRTTPSHPACPARAS